MVSAHRGAIHALRQHWGVVLALFVANLSAGGVFMAIGWTWLAGNLNNSLASRTLLNDLDANVFVDLIRHEGVGWDLLLSQGVTLLIASLILYAWLNGTAAVAVSTGANLRDSGRSGMAAYPRLLGVGAIVIALEVAVSALGIIATRLLVRWLLDSATESVVFGAWLVCAVAVGGWLFLLSAVHDHARLHCVSTDVSATRCFGWAMRFVTQRAPRSLQINLGFAAVALVTWTIYQTVAAFIGVGSMTRVISVLVWGQALMLTRVGLRVALYAAESAVQAVHEG